MLFRSNEISSFSGLGLTTAEIALANTFVTAANASGWTDIGTVRVVNIVSYGYDGRVTNRQSSLIAEVAVPEPLTVSLLGLGILGLGIMRRKMR